MTGPARRDVRARRSRGRPGPRRGAALLLVAALTLTALLTGTSQPRSAAAADGDRLPVQVQLDRLEPKAPQPHQQLVAEGQLRNTGTETVTRLRVVFDLGSYIGNRSLLASWSGNPAGFIGVRLTQSQVDVDTGRLAPGQSVPFHLSVAVDDLDLGRPGVYAFGIEARGATDQRGYGTVGRLRTPLPWAPPGSIDTKTRLAWLWPLVDRPHRGATAIFRDDALARGLASGGRLRGLLDVAVAAAHPAPASTPPRAAPGAPSPQPGTPTTPATPPATTPAAVPVTWVLDPLLLQDVAHMADGYQVRTSGNRIASGSGEAAAQSWLADLRTAVRGTDVVTLPYADVDIDALVRAGLGADVERAIFSGTDIAAAVLGAAAAGAREAWPTSGYLSSDGLQTLIGAGLDGIILRSDALPLDTDVTYTPTAHTTIGVPGGTVDVALTDAAVDDAVMAGVSRPEDARWAEQRFLAETLLFTEELPSTQRDIVVAPDRRWQPPAHYAEALLDDTATMPWLQPVTLDQVRASTPSDAPRGQLSYPARERRAELPQPYLRDVAAMGARIADLESIFVDPKTQTARELFLGGLRVESAAWRTDLRAARQLLNATDASVRADYAKVQIVSSGLVTLTSSSGTVAVSVANRLDQPVRVRLAVDAGGRAKVTDKRAVQTLGAGQLTQLEVHMQAQTNGVFRVRAQLLTPTADLRPYGREQTLLVRSTAYGTVALGISGGAFAVLLIAVAVRLTRRGLGARRRRRAGAGTDATDPA